MAIGDHQARVADIKFALALKFAQHIFSWAFLQGIMYVPTHFVEAFPRSELENHADTRPKTPSKHACRHYVVKNSLLQVLIWMWRPSSVPRSSRSGRRHPQSSPGIKCSGS